MSSGSYCLARQKSPADRWKNSSDVEYFRNWVVMLRLPGLGRKCRSGESWLPGGAVICDDCLAVEEGNSPASVRPDCNCQKPLRRLVERYLKEWNKKRMEAFKRGDFGQLAGLMSGTPVADKVADLRLKDVTEVYLKRGPKDAAKRIGHLKMMVTEAGYQWDSATVSLLQTDPLRWVLKWAELRQEHFRRGWTVRGAEPAGAWEILRREHAAGEIPKLDRGTVGTVNTTIHTYLRSAKSIFGQEARTHYHGDLKVPEMRDFCGIRLSLPKPKGMVRMDEEIYAKMWEAAARLKGENLQLWVLVQLAWRTGMRTVELLQARPSWLEFGQDQVSLVLKNRPEEGFRLKAKDRALVRPIELNGELWAGIEQVKNEQSLIGARSVNDAEKLGRAASTWIRQFVTEGQHTLYWFRKLAGSVRFTSGDIKAAGALLGHAPGSTVTGDTYADLLKGVRALSDDEIAPGKVSLRQSH